MLYVSLIFLSAAIVTAIPAPFILNFLPAPADSGFKNASLSSWGGYMNGCNQITDAAFVHLCGIHTLDMSHCNQITDAAFVHLCGIHILTMIGCDQFTHLYLRQQDCDSTFRRFRRTLTSTYGNNFFFYCDSTFRRFSSLLEGLGDPAI